MSSEQPGTSSDYFPIWLERIYADNANEVADSKSQPLQVMPQSLRSKIWRLLSEMLGDNGYVGLAGHACLLLERYWITYTRQYSHIAIGCREWDLIKEQMCNRIFLHAAVCIQLVTKLDSAQTDAGPLVAKRVLESVGQHYEVREIIKAEKEVLKGIGFRIPLWTNVDKALMMASELDLSLLILEGVSLVMDVTDRYLPIVQEMLYKITLQSTASPYSNPGPSTPSPTIQSNLKLFMQTSDKISCI